MMEYFVYAVAGALFVKFVRERRERRVAERALLDACHQLEVARIRESELRETIDMLRGHGPFRSALPERVESNPGSGERDEIAVVDVLEPASEAT